MASAEFHKWHRQNIDPQGSFQVDNFAKCWADAIKSAEALKPSHNRAMDATCDTIECPDCGAEFSVDCECPICKGHWLRHKQHQ